MLKRIVPAVLLVLIAISPVLGHEGWIDKRDGELVFLYGHGQKLDPYKPEYIREAKAFDANGKAVAVEIIRHKDYASVAPKGTPAILTMLYDSGYWVKTTDGYKNIGKREAQSMQLSIVLAEKSRKDAKAILTPCETFSKPLGLFLEIVPEKDPFALKPGEQLPLKVLLEGKPVEGMAVALGATDHSQSKNLPKTDKDGKASITITDKGLQLITTKHTGPVIGDPDADTLVACSSLTFMVK
jgi:nickel transport protein